MNWPELVKRAEKLVVDNSPAILTGVGVVGTLTTALLAGKASIKAVRILENEQRFRNMRIEVSRRTITGREKVALTWKVFVPPAVVGTITIAAIIGSNRIGARRAAALAAAYAVSERAVEEYKQKVLDHLGARKEQKLHDEMIQDRVDRNPVQSKEVILTGNGDVLCQDSYSGRYFRSNAEAIRKAVNDINQRVISDNYASLSDFYELIGLPTTAQSDEVGWNTNKLLEVRFTTAMSTDGQPCLVLDYWVSPIRGYNRLS